MPIDDIVGAAAEMVVEALSVSPDPPKRSRFWRFVYWSVVMLLVGFLGVAVYFALS